MHSQPQFGPTQGTKINHGSNQARGLIGAWPLNEAGGLVARCINRPQINGTLSGSTLPSRAPGWRGRSVEIGSGSSSRVNIADNTIIRPAQYTICAWVLFTSFASARTLVSKPTSAAAWSTPFSSWLIRINNSTTIEYGVGNASGYTSNSRTVGAMVTYRWYHLALSYDPALTTRKGDYFNGRELGTGTTGTAVTYAAQDFIIGADHGASPFTDYLAGRVADVRLYNRKLKPEEITEIYNDPGDLFYQEQEIVLASPATNFTATVAATCGGHTASVTAKEKFKGTLATSQAGQTASVSAREKFRAAVTCTQGGHTATVAGREKFKATVAVTQGAHTETLAAGETFKCVVLATQGAHTAAVVGKQEFRATIAATQAGHVSTGELAQDFAAEVNITQAGHTSALTAVERFRSTVGAVQVGHAAAVQARERFAMSGALVQGAHSVSVQSAQMFRSVVSATQPGHGAALGGNLRFSGAAAVRQGAHVGAVVSVETFIVMVSVTQAGHTAQVRAMRAFAGRQPEIVLGETRGVAEVSVGDGRTNLVVDGVEEAERSGGVVVLSAPARVKVGEGRTGVVKI